MRSSKTYGCAYKTYSEQTLVLVHIGESKTSDNNGKNMWAKSKAISLMDDRAASLNCDWILIINTTTELM